MGVPKVDPFQTGVDGMTGPPEIIGDSGEYLGIWIREMGNRAVNPRCNHGIIESVPHRMRSRSMLMRDPPGIELLVEILDQRDRSIDDIAMEKDCAIESQQVFVPLQLRIVLCQCV